MYTHITSRNPSLISHSKYNLRQKRERDSCIRHHHTHSSYLQLVATKPSQQNLINSYSNSLSALHILEPTTRELLLSDPCTQELSIKTHLNQSPSIPGPWTTSSIITKYYRPNTQICLKQQGQPTALAPSKKKPTPKKPRAC
jgi:hypothetical protein